MNERIKQLRKHLGLNQTEFGARIGVKQTTIAGYERGASTPLDAVVSAICREFNVSERWLREGDGEMFLPQDDAAELMMLAGRFLGSEPTEFQQRFARMILSLPPEGWELLERKARELLGETKKED
jgi:transcriptional regulator with XRE-family HTH domain